MSDSRALAEARSQLDAAVRHFVEVYTQDQGTTDSPVVIGWAGYAEYTSVEYTRDDVTGNVVLVPENQYAATSRGLFGFGTDAFRRGA